MAHCIVPEAEAILDKEFPVLDKGFIRLIDYLGGDERVVQSARVSYGTGTKGYREDGGLIDYLLRNHHTSPFEQVVLTFHVKLPVFVARQWVRHRTARLNEISGRYSVMQEEFYVPIPEDVALQSTDHKQGRGAEALDREIAQGICTAMAAAQKRTYTDYAGLIEQGIARELARINLPLSLYTEFYWQIDLHNLFHFLELRLSVHAQKEIRCYAGVLLKITKKVAPRSCMSFEQYVLDGVSFSREEFAEIRRRLGVAEGSAADASLEGKDLARFEAKLKAGDK
ncbi:MAG: FAD-dependent thymidylate synthase [Treponema sp.]|jgi:thymidylate synthase (FAD)|nr:FAD-dependent thymidylate synthase [Treponema sp.]